MARCLECRHLSSGREESDKRMARFGFGLCAYDKPWVYYSVVRVWECAKFSAVSAADLEVREKFFVKGERK